MRYQYCVPRYPDIRTKILLGLVAILLCCITACQIHYHKARRTPAVSGKVVDIETGEPIKGADVTVQVFGFPSNPISAFASPPRWQLAGSCLKTDSQGSFSFPSKVPPINITGASIWSYILWGPNEQIGMGVNVFSKEHITVSSQTKGFEWKVDPYYETGHRGEYGEKLVSIERERVGKHRYEYTINVKRAVTEKDWRIKCGTTILHTGLGREPDSTWRFNDLVGYLEKFPNGTKAGEYFYELLGTQPYSCSTLQDDVKNGNLKASQIIVLFRRNNKILEFADKVTLSTEQIRRKCTLDAIESRRAVVGCFEMLMKKEDLLGKRGQNEK